MTAFLSVSENAHNSELHGINGSKFVLIYFNIVQPLVYNGDEAAGRIQKRENYWNKKE